MLTRTRELGANARRRLYRAAVGVAVIIAITAVGVTWWSARGRVVNTGQVQVLIGPGDLNPFPRAEAQMGAEGDVAVLDGCLVLRSPQGVEQLLGWPHGTNVTGPAGTPTMTHDGVSAAAGDHLIVGVTRGSKNGPRDMFGDRVARPCADLKYLRVTALHR